MAETVIELDLSVSPPVVSVLAAAAVCAGAGELLLDASSGMLFMACGLQVLAMNPAQPAEVKVVFAVDQPMCGSVTGMAMEAKDLTR